MGTVIICPTCKATIFNSKRVTLRPSEEMELRIHHRKQFHPEQESVQ